MMPVSLPSRSNKKPTVQEVKASLTWTRESTKHSEYFHFLFDAVNIAKVKHWQISHTPSSIAQVLGTEILKLKVTSRLHGGSFFLSEEKLLQMQPHASGQGTTFLYSGVTRKHKRNLKHWLRCCRLNAPLSQQDLIMRASSNTYWMSWMREDAGIVMGMTTPRLVGFYWYLTSYWNSAMCGSSDNGL